MPRSSLPFVVCLVLWSSLPAQATPGGERDTGEFVFAWPVPCSAIVTKDGEKKGHTARMRFRLDLTAGADGELRVRMHEFEFLEVDGRDATTEAAQAALAQAIALAQAVPDLVVDARGSYLRIDGLEAMSDRVTKFLGEQRGESADSIARTLANMRSPTVQAVLQEACGSDWNTWVGTWVGFDPEPGSDRTVVVQQELMGVPLQGTTRLRHHGPAHAFPGHVRLSATTLVEGSEATAAFATAMQRMTAQAGSATFPAEGIEEVRAEVTFEAMTDPRSLLPVCASRTKKIRIVVKGEEPREQIERHDYTFAWVEASSTPR